MRLSHHTNDPQRTPHQQQCHNSIHQLIVAGVESLQHITGKCPDQVSERAKDHQINGKEKEHVDSGLVRQDVSGKHGKTVDDDLHIY